MRSLDFEIRQELSRYLAGEIALADFEAWFVPRAWNSEKLGDPALVELIHRIELGLAEYSRGDRTEEELRRPLVPLLTDYRITLGVASPTIEFSSSAESKSYQLVPQPGAVVDIRPVEVFS